MMTFCLSVYWRFWIPVFHRPGRSYLPSIVTESSARRQHFAGDQVVEQTVIDLIGFVVME